MSAEELLNPPSETAEKAPAVDSYEPMQRALEVPKEKERTYSGDHEGIDRAAADLDKKRGEQEQPIVREYVKYEDGAPTTERMAPNLTVTAEQAADDLKFQREQEPRALRSLKTSPRASKPMH